MLLSFLLQHLLPSPQIPGPLFPLAPLLLHSPHLSLRCQQTRIPFLPRRFQLSSQCLEVRLAARDLRLARLDLRLVALDLATDLVHVGGDLLLAHHRRRAEVGGTEPGRRGEVGRRGETGRVGRLRHVGRVRLLLSDGAEGGSERVQSRRARHGRRRSRRGRGEGVGSEVGR